MNSIKIQNIYYMLAYAFRVLNEKGYAKIATEQFEHMAEFCAAILSKGIANQIKRGLGREYIRKRESLSSPHGKMDITTSVKQQGLLQKRLICEFDEFSENAYMNQILKTTIWILIRSADVSCERKRVLKKLMLFFQEVDILEPQVISWIGIHYHRNNATYKMLINICYLVIHGLLLSEQPGVQKLSKYVDDQSMHRLYEKFILEYYRQHYPEIKVSPAYIEWDLAEGSMIDFLPAMKTDITMQYKNDVLIIDAKYYQKTMQNNTLYNSRTLHSHNLYQIFTYVKNKEAKTVGAVSGALLYAKTDETITPNEDYIISGNRISIKTLDLNADFSVIKGQLDDLVKRFFDIKPKNDNKEQPF